jgi:hypothetical protein
MPGVGRVRRGFIGGGGVRGNGVHAQYAEYTDFAQHTNDAKYSKYA